MYLSVGDYAKIEKAFKECLPNGEAYDALPDEKKKIIQEAGKAMLDTYKRHLRNNQRSADNARKRRAK